MFCIDCGTKASDAAKFCANCGRKLLNEDPLIENTSEKYSDNYSDESFWQKVSKVAKKAGAKGIYTGLLLYYAAQRPETPTRVKAVIYGALGYFILPIDLVPDLAPFVGYGDDIAVLLAALGTCALYINEEVKQQAQDKVTEWFGDDLSAVFKDIDSYLFL